MLSTVILGLIWIFIVIYVYTKMSWIPDWVILLALILVIPIFIQENFVLLVFILSSIMGYISEWIGVKTKQWEYHKKDVPFWVALAWGFTIVLIYYSSQLVSLNAFIIIPIMVLASSIQDWRNKSLEIPIFLVSNIILGLYIFRNNIELFIFAYAFSHLVEYLGAVKYKAWVYTNRISFLQLGFGYPIIVWLTLTIAQIIMGIKTLLVEDVVLFVFLVLTNSLPRYFNFPSLKIRS